MWVSRLSSAPRVVLRRTLLMLAAPLIAACLLLVGPLSQSSFANPGVWEGGNLIYDGNTYTPAPTTAPDINERTAYQWVDTEPDPDKAYLIYFDTTIDLEEQATASLVTYDLSGSDYSNPSDVSTVDIRHDLTGPEADNEQVGNTCDGSITGGIGWILCPISNWLAEVVDGLFEIIKTYLEVVPFRESNDGIYQLWGVMRTLANIAFVIAFLIIIYSQLTSIGISNYGIKTMLPRLIAGAILVNVSFWISALAVDISNLVGANINAIFVNIRENFVTGGDAAFASLNWSTVVNYLLAGGATTAGYIGFSVAAGGSIPSLFFIALSALISVAFSVLVAFVILAARQAIIVVLVLLSPLAFAAFVLPSTKKWFDRWQNSFTTLLMFFPLFGLLFGGSQLAAAAIMNSTINDPNGAKLHILLMGMAIQIVPLVLTPLLIRFSTGLLGQIANLSNNSSRGLADRAKNWATSKADYHRDRKLLDTARKIKDFDEKNGKPGRLRRAGRYMRPSRAGYQFEQGKLERERVKKLASESMGSIADERFNRRMNQAESGKYARYRQSYMDTHDYKDASDTEHGALESAANRHVQARYVPGTHEFDQRRHDIRIEASRLQTDADVYKGKFDAVVEELKAGVSIYSQKDELGNLKISPEALQQLGGVAGLGTYDDMATDWGKQVEQLSFEGTRKDMATKQQTSNIAQRLKESPTDRAYAGGIDPNGATKVEAMAISTASKEYMENVQAVTSLYSNKGYNVQQMMEIAEGTRTQLLDGTKVNDYHIHAAIQRVNSDTGNNWAVQKLADYVNSQGMNYDEATNTYTDVHGTVLDTGEVTRRRDLQQMFRDSYSKGKVRVSTISATDLSNMETGTYAAPDPTKPRNIIVDSTGTRRSMIQSEASMVRDMNSDKFKEERWITEDLDVLSRYIQNLREDSIRTSIDDDRRTVLADQIQAALTNPDNRARINGREGQLLQVIEKYLRAPASLSPSEKQLFEQEYIPPTYTADGSVLFEKDPIETTQKVPTEYVIGRQNDFPGGVGPR